MVPVFWRLVAAGLVTGLLCSALVLSLDTRHAQGAAYAYQETDYPAPATPTFDSPYDAPGEVTPTPTQQGTAQRTPTRANVTPGLETPTLTFTPAGTAVQDPNLFLTEDAQMRDARVTPGLQTLGPTSTHTVTRTSTSTSTLTRTPEPTPTLGPVSEAKGDDGKIIWSLVAVGFLLPATLLSFGVLAVTVAREAQRTS